MIQDNKIKKKTTLNPSSLKMSSELTENYSNYKNHKKTNPSGHSLAISEGHGKEQMKYNASLKTTDNYTTI